MSVAKAVLTTGKATIGGVAYAITAMSYDESSAIVDMTDTATTGDGKEFAYGRKDRKFSIDVWTDVSGSDPVMTTKTSIDLNFEGKHYIGSGSLETKSVKGSIDNVTKTTYAGQFFGAVSESHA